MNNFEISTKLEKFKEQDDTLLVSIAFQTDTIFTDFKNFSTCIENILGNKYIVIFTSVLAKSLNIDNRIDSVTYNFFVRPIETKRMLKIDEKRLISTFQKFFSEGEELVK